MEKAHHMVSGILITPSVHNFIQVSRHLCRVDSPDLFKVMLTVPPKSLTSSTTNSTVVWLYPVSFRLKYVVNWSEWIVAPSITWLVICGWNVSLVMLSTANKILSLCYTQSYQIRSFSVPYGAFVLFTFSSKFWLVNFNNCSPRFSQLTTVIQNLPTEQIKNKHAWKDPKFNWLIKIPFFG